MIARDLVRGRPTKVPAQKSMLETSRGYRRRDAVYYPFLTLVVIFALILILGGSAVWGIYLLCFGAVIAIGMELWRYRKRVNH